MTRTKLDKKKAEIAHLDNATQEIITRLNKNDKRMMFCALLSLSLLLLVGIIGIYKQNQIANQNKNHIDCIVKLLATPQKPGTAHKFIENLNTTCNIRFTQ